ncbi:MAG: hypothetical protein NTZ56_24640 [Acidobacteria bacterium]|nr:hypothetical protein [Acidobacteriota bacterium]
MLKPSLSLRRRWRLWFAVAAIMLSAAVAAGLGQIAKDPEPRWWKGNLHTHTLWSDGDNFPDLVAEWYRDHGYHFLALSDHNLLSQGELWMSAKAVNRRAGVDAVAKYRQRFGARWVDARGSAAEGNEEIRLKTLDEVRSLVEERGRFLMIPAEELTGTAGDGRSLHMNASNLAEQLVFQAGSTMRESILRNLQMVDQSAKRTGRDVLLHVNHPNYKWGLTAEDLAGVVDERFFEVWNGVDNDNDPGDATHPDTETIWDIANTLRIVRYHAAPLYGLATDDSHDHHDNKTRAVPGRAWVMVRSRYLHAGALIQAIRRGDFYATTGITLADVTFDRTARTLSLQIEPQAGAEFVTRFMGTRKGVALEGKPRRDAQGQPVETTLDYRTASGPQIGEVFAEVKGRTPSYTLRGDELYVRAVVTSTLKPVVESSELPLQRAWTQPVGWQ